MTEAAKKVWVDFAAVKAAVSMQMVLDYYPILGLQKSGEERRGPCPLPNCDSGTRTFTANLSKNVFRCFYCKTHGNVLDFVAAMEKCSVKDAALKLKEWFEVGDSEQSAPALPADRLAQLRQLMERLEIHTSQIANHATLAIETRDAIKEIVAGLDKGG